MLLSSVVVREGQHHRVENEKSTLFLCCSEARFEATNWTPFRRCWIPPKGIWGYMSFRGKWGVNYLQRQKENNPGKSQDIPRYHVENGVRVGAFRPIFSKADHKQGPFAPSVRRSGSNRTLLSKAVADRHLRYPFLPNLRRQWVWETPPAMARRQENYQPFVNRETPSTNALKVQSWIRAPSDCWGRNWVDWCRYQKWKH